MFGNWGRFDLLVLAALVPNLLLVQEQTIVGIIPPPTPTHTHTEQGAQSQMVCFTAFWHTNYWNSSMGR
jgi:hypothetical protein